MNRIRQLVAISAGLLLAAGAQARTDVQWNISIGLPLPPLPVITVPAPVVVAPAPVYRAPQPVVVYPQPVYYPAPVYEAPRHHRHWREARRDHDRDGIPDRWDRRYNPRWDVDGDGVPNRYDRRPYDPYR